MTGSMTLTDLVRMLLGRLRPLFSLLLRAITQLRCCIPLPFNISHLLSPFLRHHRRRCKRKALIIGISTLSPAPPTEGSVDGGLSAPSGLEGGPKGPHNEARSVGALLHEKYNYAEEDITILLDRPGFEYPTRENILKHMKLLVLDAREGDRFFIHFSGHSDQEDTNDPEEDDGKNEYILTCLDEKIMDDELREHLVNPLPPGSRLTAIFDSCHSGTLLDLPHYHCNQVHLPFVNKGVRRTKSRWRMQARRRAILPGSKEAVGKQLPASAESPASSTSRVPILNEQIIPGGSNAKPALSVTTNVENGQSMVFCDDSRIFASPIQNHAYCDGFGCTESGELGPNVICISSSGDAQETWEDADGTSVTAELIKIFSQNPHPVLKEVMSTISLRRYDAACILHKKAVEFRQERRTRRLLKNRKARSGDFNPEMVNFQIPQLSSLRRLPPNHLWDP